MSKIIAKETIPAKSGDISYNIYVNHYDDGERTIINCPYIPEVLMSKEMKIWNAPILKEYEFLEGVKMVYDTDYYDGPLSGHAWYQGRYCYFDYDGEDVYDKRRVYNLYDMTRLETMIQLANRCLFQDIVGIYCTHGITKSVVDTGLDRNAYWEDEYIQNIRIRTKVDVNRDSLTFIGKFV